jgi:sigma-B regulation protein RsbU (phosphoserine phosphatase)
MNISFDHAPCYYFAATDEGELIAVNEMVCSALGYKKEELIGKHIESIFTMATRIFYQTHLFPLLKLQGKAFEIFITVQTGSKDHIPLLCNISRTNESGNNYISFIGIVVENRKKFEDELLNARKTAENALKENSALFDAKNELQKTISILEGRLHVIKKQNEETSQFNKVLAHDLQEPIRKLSIYISLLTEQKDTGLPKERREKIIDKIDHSAYQMRSIVNGLQQFAWLAENNHNFEMVNLNQVIAGEKKQLEKEFPGIPLLVETDTIPLFMADESQMELLLYHILSNAIRFRKVDSHPKVRITASVIKENYFKNLTGQYKYSDCVRVEIKDSGTGFDNRFKDQVFELFKKLHPASGRGLGLSLAKKIIDNHHGKITVNSKPGEGTTIVFVIPVEKEID